jgi:hypothetical protein
MRVVELRIEQHEAAIDQPRHEVHQRDLRGVIGAREHALTEEGPAMLRAWLIHPIRVVFGFGIIRAVGAEY